MKIALATLVFISIALFVYGVFESRSKIKSLKERLRLLDISEKGLSLDEIEMAKSFSERIIVPFLSKIGRMLGSFTPTGFLERIGRKLNCAGYQKIDPLTYLGVKGIIALVFLAISFLILFTNGISSGGALIYALILPLLGFFGPDLWLQSAADRRKREINDSLPDLLDLLTVSVEAGLGFEQALMHSAEKMSGPVSGEIKRLLQDMRIGKKRSEALRDMADRVLVPDLTSFCAAMIQADQLGVSIADVLRVQSDSMRQKRRQRAEEAAMKAPLKLLFPLVFFIFPTLFIILLGPAFISIMENFKTG